MRRPRLTDVENRVHQATWAFANGRLEDIQFLEWAIALSAEQDAERTSLRNLFDHHAKSVREPFVLAWRCIFEYWQRPDIEANHSKFLVRRKLKQGGTQREIIHQIVESVRPWLRIDTSKRYRTLSGEELPKRPRHLKHLIWASISSGDRLSPHDIGLQQINDRDFLFELATALNAALLSGLNVARMIGSISQDMDITNWEVHRVYYVPEALYPEGGGEPDRYSDGFAPATKLMFAITERLASIDLEAARRIVASWDTRRWKLYRRLWAAAARNSELANAEDVSLFLEQTDDVEFWRAGSYPEIAEVRAVRWNSLPIESASRLEKRILKGEPAKLIPDSIEKADILGYKRYHIFVELRRIQAAGGNLSEKAATWLHEAAKEIERTPEVDVTHGFNQGVRLFHRGRTVTQSFEGIPNSKLLNELAKSLADSGWDDKSQNASEFIAQNASVILELLEKSSDLTVAAKVWQAFGYGFRPSNLNTGPDKASVEDKAKIPIAVQACKDIAVERPDVISKAISGLASFMGSWDRLLSDRGEFHIAWLALWPFAVMKTNEVDVPSSPLNDRAFSSSVGQLLLALISTCPHLRTGEDPMSQGFWPRIFSAIAETTGEARLQTQYVLVRDLDYFFVAAPAWASKHLLEPLKASLRDSATLDLWEGFSLGHLPRRELMSELAESIVAATISNELSGKVKGDLAERVMWSILSDRGERKEAAVPINLAQQMLRMGGDDVRKESVRALSQFLKGNDDRNEQARFELVRSVFQEVWPKELTLSSRAVSETLAEFPAAAGAFYAEAADLVLPYLTPFDCWSLYDYGVLDHNDPNEKLKSIDNPTKASAFLSVLDRTVGGEEGAIIPNGLEGALLHIRKLAPKLEKDVQYQRLLTLIRR
jgi:hypothetical protein